MTFRLFLMIAVALAAAIGAALFAQGWLNAERAALAGVAKDPVTHILVARTDISAGQFVMEENLRWQAWPEEGLAESYIRRGAQEKPEFVGAVVRNGLAAGQPITEGLVVRPGDKGFLAAVLQPGMRAVSIQVNAISGISGFVFPGDRVDLVLTHRVGNSGTRNGRLVGETVLEDVRVLAVDQETDDRKAMTRVAVAKTMTFEVTPKEAEKIAIVTRLGHLSLSLRSLAGGGKSVARKPDDADRADHAEGGQAAPPPVMAVPVSEQAGITLDTEVSRILRGPAGPGRLSIQVVRGNDVSQQKF